MNINSSLIRINSFGGSTPTLFVLNVQLVTVPSVMHQRWGSKSGKHHILSRSMALPERLKGQVSIKHDGLFPVLLVIQLLLINNWENSANDHP